MTISEDAARLRAIALPFGEIQQAMQVLTDAQATVHAVLGDSARSHDVLGALEASKTCLDGTYSVVQETERQITEAADYHAKG